MVVAYAEASTFRISAMAHVDSYRLSRHSVLPSPELKATSLADPTVTTPYAFAMTSIDSFDLSSAVPAGGDARGRQVAEFSEYKMRL